MSVSVNYSDLKPHMTELTHLIAQELDINFSQVFFFENNNFSYLCEYTVTFSLKKSLQL